MDARYDRPLRIGIASEADVTRAVLESGTMCDSAELRADLKNRFSTAVSELSRNIVKYAGRGEVYLRLVEKAGRVGVQVMAQDRGPGIVDPDRALTDHYSTAGTLGLGLPGVKRLMDEFELDTSPGNGTRITALLWS
jgi:serine/threonine-protein kinase RsbT